MTEYRRIRLRSLLRHFGIAAIIMVSVAACDNQKSQVQTYTAPQAIVPQTSNAASGGDFSTVDYASEDLLPKIAIPASDMIVTLMNANLDLDKTRDEQVLAVKSRDKADSPIRIIVASWDNVWNEYRKDFEADTLATNASAFTLSLTDVVGDHSYELVCKGMNAKGEQTLDIFRKTKSPSGFGLYYTSICSLAVNGTIDIQEDDRSPAYQLGQSNGQSFPITTLVQDTQSENEMDLIKSTYFWEFTSNRYVKEKVEHIQGEDVKQQQLRDLYGKTGVADFEKFLNGSWYATEDIPAAAAGDRVILNFDLPSRQFTFYSGQNQEVYKWSTTYRRLVNRVEIDGDNELVPYIKKQFYVQIDALDAIRITGSDSWRGTYKRLTKAMEVSLMEGSSNTGSGTAKLPSLSGYYESDNGDGIFFEDPRFTMTSAGKKLSGGYSLYSAGKDVLELKVLSGAGVVTADLRYGVDYTEETKDNQIFRTLVLTPGVVGMYGFQSTGQQPVQYEQVETVTPPQSSGTPKKSSKSSGSS